MALMLMTCIPVDCSESGTQRKARVSKQHRLISIQQHVADENRKSNKCLENLRAMAQQGKLCIAEIKSHLDFRSFILSPRDYTKQILDGQILQAVEDNLNGGIKKDEEAGDNPSWELEVHRDVAQNTADDVAILTRSNQECIIEKKPIKLAMETNVKTGWAEKTFDDYCEVLLCAHHKGMRKVFEFDYLNGTRLRHILSMRHHLRMPTKTEAIDWYTRCTNKVRISLYPQSITQEMA